MISNSSIRWATLIAASGTLLLAAPAGSAAQEVSLAEPVTRPANQITRPDDGPMNDIAARLGTASELGEGPWYVQTTDYKLKVTKLTGDLNRPWGMAFLPNGDLLITERMGRLRVVRNGILDPKPVEGIPKVLYRDFDGLMDIALHPKFRENRFVYFTYSKPDRDGNGLLVLGRGKYDGSYELKDVEELFVAFPAILRRHQQAATSRIVFGGDGMIYMTSAVSNMNRLSAQDPSQHRGKTLRLTDEGKAPADNPFVGKYDYGVWYAPEIYSIGHRNAHGLAVHPLTGAIWEVENGPMGGDELNIIEAGKNYGWPVISIGNEYDGPSFPSAQEGMEAPLLHWTPSLAPSGLMFYTGDRLPKWKNQAFVGFMRGAQIQRLIFNDKGLPIGRESFLGDLQQRIRDVREGPDGLIYVITDYAKGAVLLRIEPAAH